MACRECGRWFIKEGKLCFQCIYVEERIMGLKDDLIKELKQKGY